MASYERFMSLMKQAVDDGWEWEWSYEPPLSFDGKIKARDDHRWFSNPSWMKALVGDEEVETGLYYENLEPEVMPLFAKAMMDVAYFAAQKKSDEIYPYLEDLARKKRSDHKPL